MSIATIFIYIIYSILLYLIIEYINKSKIKEENRIIITIIYILLISAITPNNKENIFLVTILELLIRIIINTYVFEKNFFKNNNKEIIIYIITIVITYIININLINKTDTILPTVNETKIILWLIIAYYIIKSTKNELNTIFKTIPKEKEIFTKEYIVVEYAKLKNKYINAITPKHKKLIPIIYSIMIYENYYKPKIIRKIEELKFITTKTKTKFGIMQIESDKIIDDIESINITIEELEKLYNNKKNNNIIKEYIKEENKYTEINKIYNTIIEFNKN